MPNSNEVYQDFCDKPLPVIAELISSLLRVSYPIMSSKYCLYLDKDVSLGELDYLGRYSVWLITLAFTYLYDDLIYKCLLLLHVLCFCVLEKSTSKQNLFYISIQF